MNWHATIWGIERRRLAMHVLFWIVVYCFFVAMYSVKSSFWVSAHNNVFYMPIHIGYFYLVAYWLIPVYLVNARYLVFVNALILLSCCLALLARAIDILIVEPYLVKTMPVLDWDYIAEAKLPFLRRLFIPIDFFNSVKITNLIVWVALGIKLFKLWYERRQAAMEAELKALKAQVHPHFLFNTLNNLYALTLNNSPKAPGVVLGLSDLLRYMLYECNTDKVSLKKEVLMLQQYIGLEKIRYEDRLDLTFNIRGKLDDKLIAPLILLPLVENAFKHGTSEKVGQAWININLDVEGNRLKFKISNSKPDAVDNDADKHHGHIGLQNINKRLELLYPSTSQLKIMDEEDVFLAVLELELTVAEPQTIKQLATA